MLQISCFDVFFFFGGQETININNFSGLSRDRVGVKFVHVLPFAWGKGEHINKFPRKSQASAGTVLG